MNIEAFKNGPKNGDSHYMGTQSRASSRPFVVSVVHTMNTMAGAMQFSRG